MGTNVNKLSVSLIITFITIVFSVGGSFAVIKAKTDRIDGIENKAGDVDKRLIKVEVNMENIDAALKDQKNDLKQILKILIKKESDI